MSARQPGLHTGTRETRRGTASRLRIVSLLVVLAVMTGILLLNGYTHGEFAADHRVHPPVAADRVPSKVLHGGPVIDTTGTATRSHRMPDRTVALTFDDGPDPAWTPKILDVLDRYGVKGTFFVTGAATAREPALVRRMVTSGHEVGVHTFTLPDLVYRSGSRTDRELAQTQLALAGAAGIHSSLVRPPYSAHAADLDDLSWPVVRQLGAKGYVTALVDIDTEDWSRPGATAIADSVTGRLHGRGAVLPAARVWAVAVAVMAVGGWFALTHRTEEGYDLGSIPLGQALWSFGFVLLLLLLLLLLRLGPRSDRWVRRHRPLHATVVLLNARAVTVYLWHEVALVLAVVLVDRMWGVPALENSLPLGATWFLYLVVWPLIAVAVLLVGWAEDRAAKRPARLWPRPVRRTAGA